MNKKKNQKQKKKPHGALKTREAFKGTLKQWGLIRQAMLQGTKNIDCLCDYTLTLSNVCGREGNYSSCGFFSPSFFGNACLQLHVGFSTCMASRAHVWITHRQDEETETVLQGGWEGRGGARGEVCAPLPTSSALSSCFVSSSGGLCIVGAASQKIKVPLTTKEKQQRAGMQRASLGTC